MNKVNWFLTQFDSLDSTEQQKVINELSRKNNFTIERLNSKLYGNIFIAVCLVLLLLAFIYGCMLYQNEHRGTFGDMFGAYTAVFSAFSFAGVIITILMQMRDLELTRKEMRESTAAQDKAQQALNEQLDSMRLMSKFEIMNHYLNQMEENESEGRKYAAKEILKNVAEGFFKLEENENLIRPNFTPTVLTLEYILEENNNQNRIDFVNKGGHGIISIDNINGINESDIWVDRRNQKLCKIKNGQAISVFFERDFEGKFTFDIISMGMSKGKKWHQTVEVTRTPDGTCYHNISTIKFLSITRYYDPDEAEKSL